MRAAVFALALGLGAVAQAEQGKDRIAVLEVDTPDKAASDSELDYFADIYRSSVKSTVGNAYRVMTRETIAEIVPPDKVVCFLGKCTYEIGRMLQAKYVIGTKVIKLGKKIVLTSEAYESAKGEFIGAFDIKADSTESLADLINKEAAQNVKKWFMIVTSEGKAVAATQSAAPAETPTFKLGDLTWMSEPFPTNLQWEIASECCRNIGFRLPTITELKRLYTSKETTKALAAYNKTGNFYASVKWIDDGGYWSSDKSSTRGDYFYYLNLKDGRWDSLAELSTATVRCVK